SVILSEFVSERLLRQALQVSSDRLLVVRVLEHLTRLILQRLDQPENPASTLEPTRLFQLGQDRCQFLRRLAGPRFELARIDDADACLPEVEAERQPNTHCRVTEPGKLIAVE